MRGLPVVTDPNIPVTQAPGNNEDPVFVVRASDLVLWGGRDQSEGPTRNQGHDAHRAAPDLQLPGVLRGRYPQNVVEITGLTAPTF